MLEELDLRRGIATAESAARRAFLLAEMERSFPGSTIRAPKHRQYGYELADPDDQHVVHAALLSKADVIVTDDTSTRFEACPTPFDAGIEVHSVGDFVVNTVAAHPQRGASALTAMARRTKNPPLDIATQLDVLVRRYPSMRDLHDVLGDRVREP